MMVAPRLVIDLNKIGHNARTLVERLGERGILVTGVTKATLGSAEIAATLLGAGVKRLGDSRIENIEAMRTGQQSAPMTLIRSPMLSQVQRVVRSADVSCNTEFEVIKRLSLEAQKAGRNHGVILMVELGDLREGLMPDDLLDCVREVLILPKIDFKGIGTNLACRSGVAPDARNMAMLTELTELIETTFDVRVEIVSGVILQIWSGRSVVQRLAGSTICAWVKQSCSAAKPSIGNRLTVCTPMPSRWLPK